MKILIDDYDCDNKTQSIIFNSTDNPNLVEMIIQNGDEEIELTIAADDLVAVSNAFITLKNIGRE